MKTKMMGWVKLPSAWIEEGGLKAFKWDQKTGSNNTAALMVLIAVAHHASRDEGVARLSYDQLQGITYLSRTKISAGLERLEEVELIVKNPDGRSTYQLSGFDPERGWAALPARVMYGPTGIRLFQHFRLRQATELDAIKAFLAFVAKRDRKANRARITYEQLTALAGIRHIRPALSFLYAEGLVFVEPVKSTESEFGVAHAYRLAGIDPYNHPGTKGRSAPVGVEA